MTDRPNQIRPRSAHRDLSDNTCFYGDTEAGRSYRNFSENERKSARLRVKRLGSSYGHIDVKNTVKFNAASTNHDDYQGLPHERAQKIIPPDNNLKFGLEAGDNETNYSKLKHHFIIKVKEIFVNISYKDNSLEDYIFIFS